MASAASIERMALDTMEPKWRARGYTLIRDPKTEQLPSFFRDFKPDAIAVGKSPALAIEVVPGSRRSSSSTHGRLEDLFRGRDDWSLEVIYAPPSGTAVQPVDEGAIRERLAEALRLEAVAPQAALLLAWAGLEAAGRQREPDLADRGLSSGSLVDVLVSQGHVRQERADELLRVGKLRNAIAHGQIDILPEAEDIRSLVAIASSVLDGH